MFLSRLFRRSPALEAGRALYAGVVTAAREPVLYTTLGAPDTTEARFELYSAHVFLLLDRLKGQGGPAQDVAQALFDTYVRALDDALREMGVGDLSVGKKMRKLGEAFYGRVKSYSAAFESLPDRQPLEALLQRTVFADVEGADPVPLAARLVAQRDALAGYPLERLVAGEIHWPKLGEGCA